MVTKTPFAHIDMTTLNYSELKNQMEPKLNTLRSKYFKKMEIATKGYLDKITNAINETDNEETKILLKQHGNEIVHEHVNGSRRYSENIIKFRFDELNELDRAGLANYGRAYQIVYSMDNYLAEVAGEAFRCKPNDIRASIGFNMLQQGLTYKAGSRAILTNSTSMIRNMTYGWYLDVHENIDFGIGSLLRKTQLSDYVDRFGDTIQINADQHTEEVAFNVIMLAIINKLVDTIMLAVMRDVQLKIEKTYGKQVLVTSKGISSLVIQSHEYINPEDLTVHVKLNTMMLELTPTITKQFEYYKVFMEGE